MELLSVGAGTRITSSVLELVSTVKASGLHIGTWRKRVARVEERPFDLPNDSKLLLNSEFCWPDWEHCPGKSPFV